MDRKEILKQLIGELSQGAPMEEVKAKFKLHFKDVPASEIADAERLLMEEGMKVTEIQQMCDVHASLFEGAVQQPHHDIGYGHPLFVFKKENEGLQAFIDSKIFPAYADFMKSPGQEKERMLADLAQLAKIDRHYSRKENLFFPYLEKAGVTAPPKVMWAVDDEIRALIKQGRAEVEAGNTAAFQQLFPVLMEKLQSMIMKEDEILRPLLIKHLTDEDWRVIAGESDQIGFAFAKDVEGASPSDAKAYAKLEETAEPTGGESAIRLPSGFFEKNELTALLNTLPSDISYVGADDTVHFFSEQKNRIFPRTRTVIGRQVSDCHPPKSVDQVEKLMSAFKAGEKDNETYWIQRGDLFILIRYYAVRDTDGTYLGTLECTEEISGLRALEGNKTLMS
ncbi:MAG: DUF438 domain-containing protein [Clostridiales bacterium]|nr:DUF438 domain-containing protein [Clostridiales bacterium]